jgi:hypothetical protein
MSLMGEIVDLVDKYSLISVLTPDGSETPINVLKRFYRGFDFKYNREFRFSYYMIRDPKI